MAHTKIRCFSWLAHATPTMALRRPPRARPRGRHIPPPRTRREEHGGNNIEHRACFELLALWTREMTIADAISLSHNWNAVGSITAIGND
eukprot:6182344-Pleurochrysis_carterae.AAC.5